MRVVDRSTGRVMAGGSRAPGGTTPHAARAGGWFTFIALSIVLAIGAFWELLEWWTTLVVAGDVGVAFLGSQGDPWDAQWDMFLALVVAAIALPLLSRAHDRSMRRAGIMASPPAE